jgi:hypothetical protein
VKVRFHPDASAELDAAAVWYEEEQPGLGEALLAELSLATVAIAEAPQTWPLVSKCRQVRRFLLARFPFAVLFSSCLTVLLSSPSPTPSAGRSTGVRAGSHDAAQRWLNKPALGDGVGLGILRRVPVADGSRWAVQQERLTPARR